MPTCSDGQCTCEASPTMKIWREGET